MNKKSIFIGMLCFLLVFTVACGKKEDEDVLKMGFVPLVDGDKLVESVEPLSDYLTEKLGRKVEAFTATN